MSRSAAFSGTLASPSPVFGTPVPYREGRDGPLRRESPERNRSPSPFGKRQMFKYVNGYAVVHDGAPAREPDFGPTGTTRSESKMSYTNPYSVSPSRMSRPGDRSVSPSAMLGGKTLTFTAFFKESVHESSVEKFRVRVCKLYYHLEDDTLEIVEKRRDNSGLPQGRLLKRHRVPKPDGNFVSYNEIGIGEELNIYGIIYRIIDCDSFTRSFYEENGVNVPPPEEIPEDSYSIARYKEEVRDAKVKFTPKNDMVKSHVEASLGRPTNTLVKDTLKKFLENDGKVLRFYCVWDDKEAPNPMGVRRYILYYFLADDTVEIKNWDGRASKGAVEYDKFATFVSRQKLPKKYETTHDLSGQKNRSFGPRNMYTYDNVDENAFVRPLDLRVGIEVDVFGRKMEIIGCDEFTRRYYNDVYGVDVNPENADYEKNPKWQASYFIEKKPQKVVTEAPPHIGIGTPEDSLNSVLYLTPKVPRRDMKKYLENDKKILRFKTQFADLEEGDEDASRVFILQYYLADDTISVFEPKKDNAGGLGGVFLKRGRIPKPDVEDAFYKLEDIDIGNIVTVSGRLFKIIEPDGYTSKYLSGEDVIGEFDIGDMVIQIREKLAEKFASKAGRIAAFRHFNPEGDTYLTYTKFKEGLDKIGLRFTENQILRMMEYFDEENIGKLDFNKFSNRVLGEEGLNLTRKDARRNTRTPKATQQSFEELRQKYLSVEEKEAMKEEILKVMHQFLNQLTYQKDGFFLMMQRFDLDRNGKVSRAELKQGLDSLGMNMDPKIFTGILNLMYGPDEDEIYYHTLYDRLMSVYKYTVEGKGRKTVERAQVMSLE